MANDRPKWSVSPEQGNVLRLRNLSGRHNVQPREDSLLRIPRPREGDQEWSVSPSNGRRIKFRRNTMVRGNEAAPPVSQKANKVVIDDEGFEDGGTLDESSEDDVQTDDEALPGNAQGKKSADANPEEDGFEDGGTLNESPSDAEELEELSSSEELPLDSEEGENKDGSDELEELSPSEALPLDSEEGENKDGSEELEELSPSEELPLDSEGFGAVGPDAQEEPRAEAEDSPGDIGPEDEEEELDLTNDRQAETEAALMSKFPSTLRKKAPTSKKSSKQSKYVALNPAQQPMINFLARPNREPVTRFSWRAQLCIPPLNVDTARLEVPADAKTVSVQDVPTEVIAWSKRKSLAPLHLQIDDVYLTFERCVASPIIDLSKPFTTLQAVLAGENLLYELQNQFAEYGLVFHLTKQV